MFTRSSIRRPLPYSAWHASFWLIGVNALVFFLMYFALPELYGWFAMVPSLVSRGWVWQFVTYLFIHGGISHLFFNMLGLFFFGPYVEREMGSSEFLLFYLVTGTLAGVFSFFAYSVFGASQVPLVGASGAIYAILLAFAAYNPNAVIYVYGLLPVRAPWLVLGYSVMELGSHFLSFRGGVAHLTHLAGFAFAALYFAFRLGMNPIRRLFPSLYHPRFPRN
ncbi:MAG: rhomboid family intramembrane serine protease [Spirochaetales bacterium]|nr:rhomboid family intramembrane serine protease [Spirochaetales bacterium]